MKLNIQGAQYRRDPHDGPSRSALGLVEDRGGDAIAKAGLKLLGEYAWMKPSFYGIHVGYLAPITKNAPEDYRRILERFSLVEAEVWQHERADEVSDP